MKIKSRGINGLFKNKYSKALFFVLGFTLLCSHNLYIKMSRYFLKPNQETTLSLYNGTFEKSENLITRDRILDASILINGSKLKIDESLWVDKDSVITQFNFTPVEQGTYVSGVSTKARNIELTAEKFNDYLKHDGILDILEQRKTENSLQEDAVESYEKHVKAIYQVGEQKTEDWKTELGYPIEFVPQENPYDKFTGDKLDVQLLLDGRPLADQLVYADYVKVFHNHNHGDHTHDHDHSHSHGHDDDHSHDHAQDSEEHSHGHNHDDGQHSQSHDSNAEDEHERQHDHGGEEHFHEHKYDENHQYDNDNYSNEKETHSHSHGKLLRTNPQGIVTVDFPEDGVYYLRTIYMTKVADSQELTHQSKWATLTFEVTHNHETHAHDDHDHEEGIPAWIFVVGSVFVIGLLFLLFRKKN